jgi:hypothetical protein
MDMIFEVNFLVRKKELGLPTMIIDMMHSLYSRKQQERMRNRGERVDCRRGSQQQILNDSTVNAASQQGRGMLFFNAVRDAAQTEKTTSALTTHSRMKRDQCIRFDTKMQDTIPQDMIMKE